ncbi:MAG: hypothetical protein HQK69_10340, partial [Desulfamplus sp.]|nr:hypothetical protein [Desulfamplus sp.]
SILFPFLIGAILVYGYLDIKQRVINIHNSGQTQVDVVAKEFESKLNTFEVEMAKIKFALEKDIPELKQQTIAIQDELTLLAGNKSDKEATDKNIELIKADIAKIADQYQGALHILDRTNQETLSILNEKANELESKVDTKLSSIKEIETSLANIKTEIENKEAILKTNQADIEAKIASVTAIESKIDSKIDSKVDSIIDKKLNAATDKKYAAIINEKLSSHRQSLEKKVADIDLTVESKLAALEEATQILAENKEDIEKLKNSLNAFDKSITNLDKELKNLSSSSQQSVTDKDIDKDYDKKYVDTQIAALRKNLNNKIEKLDLTLSKKILQYATQLESTLRSYDSKKKGESVKIIKVPEKGKISETDLVQ